jgi:hypothetical protein
MLSRKIARQTLPVVYECKKLRWGHGKQNGTLQIPVSSPILFFQMWHFDPGLRGKMWRKGLYALFDRILVDFELLKIRCVCVCVCACAVGWVFLVWDNFKLIFLTFLSLKKLCWDVKSISAYLFFFFFRFVGSSEALKIENSHMKVKNWSCTIYWYGTFSDCKFLVDSKNIKVLLFGGQL